MERTKLCEWTIKWLIVSDCNLSFILAEFAVLAEMFVILVERHFCNSDENAKNPQCKNKQKTNSM